MTWTWQIDGLGTTEQTLTVYDDSGEAVASETRESWTWTGNYPEFVYNTVAQNDLLAALTGDIEQAE